MRLIASQAVDQCDHDGARTLIVSWAVDQCDRNGERTLIVSMGYGSA